MCSQEKSAVLSMPNIALVDALAQARADRDAAVKEEAERVAVANAAVQ